jgi:hypothetical protein
MPSPTAESPFASFGTVARGPRFFGRESILEAVSDRVLHGGSSAALIGLPRIGKSSVAGRVVDDLRSAGVEYSEVTASACQDGADFLREVAFGVDPSPDGLQDLSAVYRALKRSLRTCHAQSRRHVVIVDEFDAIRHWADGARTMHILRDLLYDPSRVPLAGLFMCRRPLERLELELAGVSTFAGVVQQVFVSHLSQDDIRGMAARSPATKDDGEAVYAETAGHPFLAERALHARHTQAADNFSDYYAAIGRFLKDEGLQGRLLFIVAGAASTPDVEADALLSRYGLVVNGRPFSDHFRGYLEHLGLNLDLWGEFGTAERAVRTLLDRNLTAKYGALWLVTLKDRHPKPGTPVVYEAMQRRTNDARKWPRATDRALIDYTYPRDLLVILRAEWQHVSLPRRYRDKQWWHERLEALARVRAPLAHERGDILEEAEVAHIRYFCQEILEACRAAEADAEGGC